MLNIALIGNPNCGKTTIFNALTGSKQVIGNWPGVTVERKSGIYVHQQQKVRVIDLPGTYSLSTPVDGGSIDERIACEYILSGEPDLIVNIIDSANLERNLYLTLQLQELGIPMLVVLNMADIIKQRRVCIDEQALSNQLGCPVVSLQASKRRAGKLLKGAIHAAGLRLLKPEPSVVYAPAVESTISYLQSVLQVKSRWLAIHLLEEDAFAEEQVDPEVKEALAVALVKLSETAGEDIDVLLAEGRYTHIEQIVSASQCKTQAKQHTITDKLDKIVLNRFLGIPIFLLVMYFMFFFAINIGGAFQDFFDIGSDTIFVQGLSHLLSSWHWPGWLVAFIAAGLGKGINTVVTFAPIIGTMFLFLAFLQGSGYMVRAAFVVDRFMRAIGLPGKSFVPMIVGFGCNVPAIMGARTLESRRDRVLTVLMSPFMSCGARLAIFAVFTAAFFSHGGALIVFALYFTGIVMAILTGLLLRKTILKGGATPFVMELPPYHLPTLKSLFTQAWQRLKVFLFKAGKVIIPVCVLISALNAVDLHGNLVTDQNRSQSVLSSVGKAITPVFAPIGIQQDNWPATLGLVTGTLAKEVVVGTLNTLYVDVGHLQKQQQQFNFVAGLKAAAMSIPENLSQLGQALANPVLASEAETDPIVHGVFGQMAKRFDGKIGAFAYLLFILLYVPCVSTVAVMAKELNRGWAAFSVAWTTILAYGVAVVFYQTATIMRHPHSSLAWIFGVVVALLAIIASLRLYARKTSGLRDMRPRDISLTDTPLKNPCQKTSGCNSGCGNCGP